MRKFRLLSLLFLAASFVVVSCTKEGPEGPAGAAGAQGPAGSAGAPGAPGAPGAGVTTYSPWFTTVEDDWVDAYAPPYWALWSFTKAAPGVTQAILDNGVVLAYMKNWTYFDDVTSGPLKATNTVVQLPYKVDIDFQDLYDYAIPAAGTIDFLYKSGFQTWANSDIAGTSFRYVIIPGSVAGGRSADGSERTYEGYTKTQLQAMSYEQVAAIFHIPATGSNIQ